MTTVEPHNSSVVASSGLTAYFPAIALPDPANAPAQFEGAVLAIVLSGTNTLLKNLAKAGREGAEQFSHSFNGFLSRILTEVEREGGQVATLEGDELLIFFPQLAEETDNNCRERAARTAQQIAPLATSELTLAAGLGYGQLHFLQFGSPVMGYELVLAGAPIREARVNRALPASSQLNRLEAGGISSPVSNTVPTTNLGRWLPPVVWQKLREEPNFSGDWQRVVALTVLFDGADYKSGDGLQQLQTFYNQVEGICSEQSGLLYRFQPSEGGEAHQLTLIFGALLGHSNDAERALRAALQIRRLPEKLDFIKNVAISVTSSVAFVGVVGTSQQRRFAIIGEALSAALLATKTIVSDASLRQQGGLLVDSYTSERVPLNFLRGETRQLVQPEQNIFLKVAPLFAERKFVSSLKRYWKDEIRLVGRRAELAQIDALASEVLGGQTRTIAISGAAGIGKSALLGDASRQWLSRAGNGAVGVCYQYSESWPYLGWTGVLAWLCDFVDADTRMARVAKINSVIASYAADYPELVAPIQQILNVTPFNRQLFDALIEPGTARDRFFEFWARLIEGKSADVPLMIELENMQWADTASLDLLAFLTRRVQAAVVFAVTARQPFENLPQGTLQIELAPLAVEESRQLASQLNPALTNSELEKLLNETGGNPQRIGEAAHRPS